MPFLGQPTKKRKIGQWCLKESTWNSTWAVGTETCRCNFCGFTQKVPVYNYSTYCLKCGRLPLEWIPAPEAYCATIRERRVVKITPSSVKWDEDQAYLQEVINEAKENYYKLRPRIGLDVSDFQWQDPWRKDPQLGAKVGLIKSEWMPTNPLERIQVGDILLRWNDTPITSKEDYLLLLEKSSIGDEIVVKASRNGEIIYIKIQIGCQIKKEEHDILQQIVGGSIVPEYLTRVKGIVINDKKHVCWNMSVTLGLKEEYEEELVDFDYDIARGRCTEMWARLKPRIGAEVAELEETDSKGFGKFGLKIVQMRSLWLPEVREQGLMIGDILHHWNGRPLKKKDEYYRYLELSNIGEYVELLLKRDGKLLICRVRIGCQVREEEANALQSVMNGSALSHDVLRARDVSINDRNHVCWGMELIDRPSMQVEEMEVDDTELVEDQVRSVKQKWPLLKARIGFDTADFSIKDENSNETMNAVKVVIIRTKNLPEDPEQQIRKDDVITEFNGVPVPNKQAYSAEYFKMKPGDIANLSILRNGKKGMARIKVGCQVSEEEAALIQEVALQGLSDPGQVKRASSIIVDDKVHNVWGMSTEFWDIDESPADDGEDAIVSRAMELWPRLKPRTGIECADFTMKDPLTGESKSSVKVVAVKAKGLPSDTAHHILHGDIIECWNGEPVTSRSVFFQNIGISKPGDTVFLDGLRNMQPFKATVRIGCQIPEAEAVALQKVAVNGSRDPEDLAAARMIQVDDRNHVLWGINIQFIETRPSTAVVAESLDDDEAVKRAGELWAKLKPRIGLETNEFLVKDESGESKTEVKIVMVRAKGLPQDTSQHIRQGDIVEEWGDVPIKSRHDFLINLGKMKLWDTVKLSVLRDGRNGEIIIRVGSQVPEDDALVLKRVAMEGSRDPEDLERVRKIRVDDSKHIIWGMQADFTKQRGELMEFDMPDEDEEACAAAAAKYAKLKPRIGLETAEATTKDPSGNSKTVVRIVRIIAKGLPEDVSQQIQQQDIVESWNENPISSRPDFLNNLGKMKIGDTVYLSIVRDGVPGKITIRVGCQVSENEANVLKRLTDGERIPEDILKSKEIVVDDRKHVIWGMEASFSGKQTQSLEEMDFFDEAIIAQAKETWAKLKPRIGLETTEYTTKNDQTGESKVGVKIVQVKAKGLPEDTNQQIQVHDIIDKINGVQVSSRQEFLQEVAKFRIGENITVDVLRDGKRGRITIRVGAQVPEDEANALQKVIDGSRDPDDIKKAKQVVVDDRKHYVWGMTAKFAERRGARQAAVVAEETAEDSKHIRTRAGVKAENDEIDVAYFQDKYSKLRPRLGIETADFSGKTENGEVLNAVKVVQIKAKGLQDYLLTSDTITRIGDVVTTSKSDYLSELSKMKPGDKVIINFTREGRYGRLTVTVGAQISEEEANLIKGVAEHEITDPGEVARARAIEIDDKKHVVWGHKLRWIEQQEHEEALSFNPDEAVVVEGRTQRKAAVVEEPERPSTDRRKRGSRAVAAVVEEGEASDAKREERPKKAAVVAQVEDESPTAEKAKKQRKSIVASEEVVEGDNFPIDGQIEEKKTRRRTVAAVEVEEEPGEAAKKKRTPAVLAEEEEEDPKAVSQEKRTRRRTVAAVEEDEVPPITTTTQQTERKRQAASAAIEGEDETKKEGEGRKRVGAAIASVVEDDAELVADQPKNTRRRGTTVAAVEEESPVAVTTQQTERKRQAASAAIEGEDETKKDQPKNTRRRGTAVAAVEEDESPVAVETKKTTRKSEGAVAFAVEDEAPPQEKSNRTRRRGSAIAQVEEETSAVSVESKRTRKKSAASVVVEEEETAKSRPARQRIGTALAAVEEEEESTDLVDKSKRTRKRGAVVAAVEEEEAGVSIEAKKTRRKTGASFTIEEEEDAEKDGAVKRTRVGARAGIAGDDEEEEVVGAKKIRRRGEAVEDEDVDSAAGALSESVVKSSATGKRRQKEQQPDEEEVEVVKTTTTTTTTVMETDGPDGTVTATTSSTTNVTSSPPEPLQDVGPDIIKSCKDKLNSLKPRIGFETTERVDKESGGGTRVRVLVVQVRSKGLPIERNDIVVSLNGAQIQSKEELLRAVLTLKIGSECTLEMERSNQIIKLKMVVGCQLSKGDYDLLTRISQDRKATGSDLVAATKVQVSDKSHFTWGIDIIRD